jgi:serine/threonine protein kinase
VLFTAHLSDSCTSFDCRVPGGSIAQLQSKFGRLSESVIRNYAQQILAGLNYLHSNGIVHCDIKGANLLVDDRGNVKVADFGASTRLSAESTEIAKDLSLRGSPYYMAPEIVGQAGAAISCPCRR